jgi:hypothetical protein
VAIEFCGGSHGGCSVLGGCASAGHLFLGGAGGHAGLDRGSAGRGWHDYRGSGVGLGRGGGDTRVAAGT